MAMLRKLIEESTPILELKEISELKLLDNFLILIHVVVEMLIDKLDLVQNNVCPHTLSFCGKIQIDSVFLTVPHKRSELLVVNLIDDE